MTEPIDLERLNPREEQVIRMRFGLGRTQRTLEEVGQRLSVSRKRIRQIEAKALRKCFKPRKGED